MKSITFTGEVLSADDFDKFKASTPAATIAPATAAPAKVKTTKTKKVKTTSTTTAAS